MVPYMRQKKNMRAHRYVFDADLLTVLRQNEYVYSITLIVYWTAVSDTLTNGLPAFRKERFEFSLSFLGRNQCTA